MTADPSRAGDRTLSPVGSRISKGKNRWFAWIKPVAAGEGDMGVGREKGQREAQVGGRGGGGGVQN